MPAPPAVGAGVLERPPPPPLATLEDEQEAAAGDPLATGPHAAAEAHAAAPDRRVRDAWIVLDAGTRTDTARAAASAPPAPLNTRR